MKDNLTVNIFTVDRQIPPMKCDYVKLSVSDSKKGRFSGSYGVKRGHAKAVFSLKKGVITVYNNEKVIFTAETSNGFAVVENDVLNVTVDTIEEKSNI